MQAQYKEWSVCGASPFYVQRSGIGIGGQWHLNAHGQAQQFRTHEGAQRRAAKLNSRKEG